MARTTSDAISQREARQALDEPMSMAGHCQGLTTMNDPREASHFPAGVHRIPFSTYTRDDVYREELARIFYRGHWCYVGL